MALPPPPIETKPLGANGHFDWDWALWFNKVKELNTEGDLSLIGDTGTGSVDLVSQSLSLLGTSGEINTSVSGQTATFAIDSAITTAITPNTANIATNTTDIATNVTNIATNVTDIAANTASIAALDLDFAGDSGTGTVSDSQTFNIIGTSLEVETSASGQTLTVGLPNSVTLVGSLTAGDDVNVTNSVSIGTTGSSTPLHIYRNNSVDLLARLEQDGIGDPSLEFLLTGGQSFKMGISNNGGDVFKIIPGTNFDADDSFVIGTNGYLGLGEESPTKPLDILGSSSTLFEGIQITNEDWGTGETTQTVDINFKLSVGGSSTDDAARITIGKDDDWDDTAASDSFMAFKTNVSGTLTEHARIDSNGNMGIGIDSPTKPLHLYRNDTSRETIRIEQDGTGDASISFFLTAAEQYSIGIDNSDSNKFKISDSGFLGAVDRFVINSSGDIAVGTSDPQQKFHVEDQNPIIRLSDNDSSSISTVSALIEYYDRNNTGRAGHIGFPSGNGDLVIRNDATGSIHLNTLGNQRLSVATGGDVTVTSGNSFGIGTTPSHLLDIYADDAETTTMRIQQDGTGDASIQFRRVDAGPDDTTFITGIDNSDANKFKLSLGSTLGTNDVITVATNGVINFLDDTVIYNRTDANRGSAGTAGRVIFNTDDGQLNIDNGANWTLPDGTTT